MAIDPNDPRMFDVRLRTRLLKEGRISPEDVKVFLDNLPDAEDNLDISEVELENRNLTNL